MEAEDNRPVLEEADMPSKTEKEETYENAELSNSKEDQEITDNDDQPSMEHQHTIISEDEKDLNDQERIQLYDKGMKFKSNHNYQHALLCFLGCIKGLKQTSTFPLLPNCLQNIASIYAKFEDFPKAVQFMQAAKLYYETAIMGTKEAKGDDGYQTMDENATEDDAKRANEYEKLSHDCLKEKNIQLALEYCGKSTQLRRKVYGENHAVTVSSLDLFTMIYAEMGKMEYTEAIGNFEKKVTFADEVINDAKDKQASMQDPEEDEYKKKEKVLMNQNDKPSSDQDGEPKEDADYEVSGNFLSLKQMILIIFLSIIAAVLITWAWCQITESKVCPSYSYTSERIKLYYYYYVKSWLNKNIYF